MGESAVLDGRNCMSSPLPLVSYKTTAFSVLLTSLLLAKKSITLLASFDVISCILSLLSQIIMDCVSSAKFYILLSSIHKSKSAIRIMNSNGDNLDP